MRNAWTLIELLVALAIISILGIMMVLVWPKPQPEVSDTTQLQGMLVEARCKALRDQRPCGVQTLNGQAFPIEQPDDIIPGPADFTSDGTTITVTGTFPATIQPGDWVEKGSGAGADLAKIVGIVSNSLLCQPQRGSTAAFWTAPQERNWRVVPQPRTALGATSVPCVATPDQSVLFAPSGSMVGASAPARWIVGGKYVVQVQPGTGAVQVHPVAPGADPFAFTRDGKGSGF